MNTATTATTEPLDPAGQVAQLVQFYESLSPQSVGQLDQFYNPQARFTDPFNDVIGVVAITRIFDHMFVNLHQPRFVKY